MTKTPTNTQTNAKLPEFTDVISIEVEVNAIYKRLLSTFPENYQHKEILSHAIIGSANTNGGIAYIYNALNGYTNEIDFEIGDMVICTSRERKERYDSTFENEDGSKKEVAEMANPAGHKPRWAYRNVEIGVCEIVDINLYDSNKLKVRFLSHDYGISTFDKYENEPIMTEVWVNHKKCTIRAKSEELVPVQV